MSLTKDDSDLDTHVYNNIFEGNTEMFIKNKIKPDVLDIKNISHNSPSCDRKMYIDTDVTKGEFKLEAATASITGSNKTSITESSTSPKHKSEINILRKYRKPNKNIIPININENDPNIKINVIYKTVMNNNATNVLNVNRNSNECSKGPNLKVSYNNFNNNNSKVCKTKNKSTHSYIIILTSDEEDANSQVKNDDKYDTISISSYEGTNTKETRRNQNIDSDCSGYHSSDFELIDEEEAKKFGLIDYNPPIKYNNNDINTVINKEQKEDYFIHDYFDNPVPKDEINGFNYNHKIPQNNDYINLFHGNYIPLSTRVETKAISTALSMNTDFEAIGFDMRNYQENQVIEAFKQEAYDCERKIRSMYPYENRRNRRRRY